MSQFTTLSRLLSLEGISVSFINSDTAHFDIVTRELCLPNWSLNMPHEVATGFTIHEIGHAKWSTEEIYFRLKRLAGSHANIIEDIRIENLLSDEYPGARNLLRKQYEQLAQIEFFCRKTLEDVIKIQKTLHPTSRLNVIAKCGNMCGVVPISKEEEEIFNKLLAIRTEDEMFATTEEYLKFLKEYPQPTVEEVEEDEEGEGLEEEEENVEGVEDSNIQIGPTNLTAPIQEKEEEQSTPTQQGSDSSESENSTNQETESENSTNQETESDLVDENDVMKDLFHNPLYEESLTMNIDQDAFDEIWFNDVLKTLDSEVEFSGKRSALGDFCIRNVMRIAGSSKENKATSGFNLFVKKWETSSVRASAIADEFKQRLSGMNYANSYNQETGELDMDKIHEYKYNDNIFEDVMIAPNMQNHGVIMMVDFSGSMHERNGWKIEKAIDQLMLMMRFCRQAEIPFRVIGYGLTIIGNPNDDSKDKDTMQNYVVPNKKSCQSVEIANSQYDERYEYSVLYNIFYCLTGKSVYWDLSSFYRIFQSGGTPMLDVLMAMPTYIMNFKRVENIQNVSLMNMTDGYPTTSLISSRRISVNAYDMTGYTLGENSKAYCSLTNKVYGIDKLPLSMRIKEITGCTLVGFYIDDMASSSEYVCEATNRSLGGEQLDGDYMKELQNNSIYKVKSDTYDVAVIVSKMMRGVDSSTPNSLRKFITNNVNNLNERIFIDAFLDEFA